MPASTVELSTWPAARYRGTFAPAAPEPAAGGDLPFGWEGVYFPFDTPLAGLRPDGSPADDDLPGGVDGLSRRYAGEETVFHRPLRYGDEVTQVVRRGAVTEKHGRGGRMVFADLVREYRVGAEVAVESVWHDVFVEPGPPRPPVASLGDKSTVPIASLGDKSTISLHAAAWREEVILDERQLFRFSALTFNTHRIHYDRRWAVDVEGLADLLVHGPLTRILLLDALLRHEPERRPTRYEFRALAPVTVGLPVTITGHGAAEVLATGPDATLLARGRIG